VTANQPLHLTWAALRSFAVFCLTGGPGRWAVSFRRRFVTEQQSVLVIGGTRGTGLLIARLLQQRGHGVRVLARDPARARTLFDSSIEVVAGDLTKPETLPPAVDGARHIIFTAGCRSGYPVREPRIKAVEYEGVLQTLDAARQVAFAGRFLYMTSSGVLTQNVATRCLNLWKGNTLVWRRRVEDRIRTSGLDYTVIRVGVLVNQRGGEHLIEVTQHPLPLAWRYRIARADVAEIFLAALGHRKASRTIFEAVWGARGEPKPFERLLDSLQPEQEMKG
jgi:uncharacterized protein YbjT (DUF2867 family)